MDKLLFSQRIKNVTNPLPGSTPKPTKYRLPVKKKYEGFNVVDFFLTTVPRSTKTLWLQKIKNKTLFINGKPAKENSVLKAGYITEHTSEPKIEPRVSNQIELLFWDENLVIINKPAPLPMHPSGRFNRNSLTEILKIAFPEENFKIIHRLDANTTGIVVLAKNKDIIKSISNQFENKTTKKKYLALVEGIPKLNNFNTTTKIGLEKTAGGGRAKSENGIYAYTEFKVIHTDKLKNETLLEVTPHTGRTNQIRLHLAELKLPIIGDIGYKNPDYFKNNPLTYHEDCLFLHAWQLCFTYKNQQINFTAPIPNKFKST